MGGQFRCAQLQCHGDIPPELSGQGVLIRIQMRVGVAHRQRQDVAALEGPLGGAAAKPEHRNAGGRQYLGIDAEVAIDDCIGTHGYLDVGQQPMRDSGRRGQNDVITRGDRECGCVGFQACDRLARSRQAAHLLAEGDRCPVCCEPGQCGLNEGFAQAIPRHVEIKAGAAMAQDFAQNAPQKGGIGPGWPGVERGHGQGLPEPAHHWAAAKNLAHRAPSCRTEQGQGAQVAGNTAAGYRTSRTEGPAFAAFQIDERRTVLTKPHQAVACADALQKGECGRVGADQDMAAVVDPTVENRIVEGSAAPSSLG